MVNRPTHLLLLVAVSLATGCGGDVVSDFRGAPEDVYELAAQSVRHPDEVRQAALDHLDDEDPEVGFGSLYALTMTAEPGPSMEALAGFLDAKDVEERLLAADALVSRGDQRGLPILIAALGSEEPLTRLDPPQVAWAFARFTLLQHTDQDLGLKEAEGVRDAAEAKPAWELWLADAGSGLRWDPAERWFTA